MKIDAHQHFWSLSRGDYDWLTPELTLIYRDFLPADLVPLIEKAGIEGTIVVQAAPSAAETEFMLSLADHNPFIKGVIGWTDFESADISDQIAKLAAHPALVGLRPMIQDIEDPDWMLKKNLEPAFVALHRHNLVFDALVLPHHLQTLRGLLSRLPDLCVVINHGSKPLIREKIMTGWAENIASIARESTAFCKLSGLVTEAKPGWKIDDLRPYTDHLLDSFGPDRLIWGSDWPVCTMASSYEYWVETTDILLSGLTTSERAAILGGNASRVYSLRA